MGYQWVVVQPPQPVGSKLSQTHKTDPLAGYRALTPPEPLSDRERGLGRKQALSVPVINPAAVSQEVFSPPYQEAISLCLYRSF